MTCRLMTNQAHGAESMYIHMYSTKHQPTLVGRAEQGTECFPPQVIFIEALLRE
ncbi:hypothetical protein ACRALDRAFT_210581 [Sodiomyces alcalophilus JCM 7366]|uniref:uncharacterized protein n=1 Tax=Sodiomyces alcalophilus JCM 7366 TaxID=591952 RepID=UPI0039B5B326